MPALLRDAYLALPPSATRLAMACALLGAVGASEIASGALAPAPTQVAELAATTELAKDEVAQDSPFPPVSSFSEVVQRPLFSATRRPGLAADQSGQAWSSFVLRGVIVTPITREALLLHNKQTVLVSLREGEALDGWIAETILPDRVVFRNGTEEHDLKLATARRLSQEPVPADRVSIEAPSPPARPEPPGL
jgi:hypothetical protein